MQTWKIHVPTLVALPDKCRAQMRHAPSVECDFAFSPSNRPPSVGRGALICRAVVALDANCSILLPDDAFAPSSPPIRIANAAYSRKLQQDTENNKQKTSYRYDLLKLKGKQGLKAVLIS